MSFMGSIPRAVIEEHLDPDIGTAYMCVLGITTTEGGAGTRYTGGGTNTPMFTLTLQRFQSASPSV